MEGNYRIPGPLEVDDRLAYGALERLVRAFAVCNPRQHAVLVRLEGAGTRVDPGSRVVGGLLVGEADEAAAGRIRAARGGYGFEGLGRYRRGRRLSRAVGIHGSRVSQRG